MKKMLLGSTALATAGLVAAPAVASELSIRISGYMNSGFYITDADDREIDAFELQANTGMASLDTLNRQHPLNKDKVAPETFIFAACETGYTGQTNPLMADEFKRCKNDTDMTLVDPTRVLDTDGNPVAADNDDPLYFTQTALPSRDEYSQSQVKLGSGRIVVDADARLENGMQVGGRVRIEAFGEDEASEIIDEHYVYVNGGFGRIVFGAKNGAAYQMHYSSPWFVPGNGVDSPNFYNISRTSVRTNTYAKMSDDAIKLTYFTPRFGGFQLGASYTPNNRDEDGLGNGFNLETTEATGSKGLENIIDVGVNYVRRFEAQGYYPFDVALSAGYESGSSNMLGSDDPLNWTVGGALEWRTFTLGGAYYYGENLDNTPNTNGRETSAWTAGVAWNSGPYRLGVAYLVAEEEGGKKSNGITPMGTEENSFLQFGGGYTLGRGVDLGLDVQLIEDDSGGNADEKNRVLESTSVGVILDISF
ncbi:MAG: porin [Parvularculales bacterium]